MTEINSQKAVLLVEQAMTATQPSRTSHQKTPNQ